MGFIEDPVRKYPNIKLIVRRPKTAAEVRDYFKQGGVVKWGPNDTDEGRVSRGWPSALDIAPDEMFEVYMIQSFENPFVHFATTGTPSPTPAVIGKDAYLVFDQTNLDWGKFRMDNGGRGQIMTLTFGGTTAAATVSGHFDGFGDISFIDTGTNAGNATKWAALANGNVQHSGIGTFTVVGAVVTFTAKDTSVHTFTNTSNGGPTIVSLTTQTAIPAIAEITGLKFLEASVEARPGISRAALNMSY